AALDALPAAAPWREWLERLDALAAATLADPAPVRSVLAELWPMGEAGPGPLEEVRQVLTGRLRLLRVEPETRRYGRVFVGTIPEAAARSFEIVFLPGVSEGVFPGKALEDALLLDAFRPEPLERRDDRTERER